MCRRHPRARCRSSSASADAVGECKRQWLAPSILQKQAAASNEAYSELAIPAVYPGVMSVGSVDANGEQAYFSNSGQGLGLTAPGVGVITAWDTNKIALASGTSQSSALVTGATAAYLGWGVASSNVTARLKADARPTGAPANQVGAGILTIKAPPGR